MEIILGWLLDPEQKSDQVKKNYIYKQFIILNIVLSIKYSKKNVLSNVIFVFMLVSYGFEKPLYYFHYFHI